MGYDALSDQLSAAACRLRFAHTSPIYITVGGKGARVPDSVAEAEKMLDAFERFAAGAVGDQYKADLDAALKTARERLRNGGPKID